MEFEKIIKKHDSYLDERSNTIAGIPPEIWKKNLKQKYKIVKLVSIYCLALLIITFLNFLAIDLLLPSGKSSFFYYKFNPENSIVKNIIVVDIDKSLLEVKDWVKK